MYEFSFDIKKSGFGNILVKQTGVALFVEKCLPRSAEKFQGATLWLYGIFWFKTS